MSQWCERNGLVMTGHFACEDGLCDQISSCGGIMGHYALMQLPGIDYLGNRVTSPVLMKQAASVSRQFNGGEVLSETFGCSGWGVTLARLAWIWGWQSALGVTKPLLPSGGLHHGGPPQAGLPRLLFLSGALVGRVSGLYDMGGSP